MPERIWRGVPVPSSSVNFRSFSDFFDLLARQNLDDGHLDLAEIVEADGRQRLGQRVGGRSLRRDVQGLQLGKLLLRVDAREQRRARRSRPPSRGSRPNLHRLSQSAASSYAPMRRRILRSCPA